METIKSVVENLFEKWEKKKSASVLPQELLKKVLTKKELGHIKFNYFKNGILSLNVDSSTWLYHLTLQKEQILTRLNSESLVIKDIRFRIGEIK